MNIFLSGANGMVGQNILQNTKSKNYNFIAPPKKSLNLLKTDEIHHFFQKHSIDLVIHAAGIVGGIEANISNPSRYLLDNTQMGINLINVCKKNKIKNLINLASSCMYPKDSNEPLTENMILSGPLEPTNEGYALAKILVTRLCEYISFDKKNFSYKTVIPCNLYGEFDNFKYESSHLIPAVIRKIYEAKKLSIDEISIWGDGLARREFMYAKDFSNFIFYAIEHFERMPQNLNVGLGYDFSINEYYQIISKIIGYDGKFTHDMSKPVGMKQKLLNIDKLNDFGWKSDFDINQGINETFQFFKRANHD